MLKLKVPVAVRKMDVEATSWPIMSVFGYDASPLRRVLCGQMSGSKTTAIATQNGQANLAVFVLNFGHQCPESDVRFILQHLLSARRIR
jgi:hypothetical protein